MAWGAMSEKEIAFSDPTADPTGLTAAEIARAVSRGTTTWGSIISEYCALAGESPGRSRRIQRHPLGGCVHTRHPPLNCAQKND